MSLRNHQKRENSVTKFPQSTLCWFLVLVFFSLAGCASQYNVESFMREEVDLSYVKTIAVLPFENNTQDPLASRRCREIVITEAMSSGLFETEEKSQTDSAMQAEAVNPGAPMDSTVIRRIGQRLDVQALLMGSVDEVKEGRKGNYVYPEVSISMRLVDTESGTVLWQGSGYASGYSVWTRLFGFGGKDRFQVTLGLIRELFESIWVDLE